jgi:hypothetical protein
MVALAVRHRGDDLDGALDHMLYPGQGRLNQRFEPGKALGGLHPVIPDPFEALGHHMLHLCGQLNYVARVTQIFDLM